MQVFFESRDPQGAEMRDVAVQRLQFVLRRLTWLVPHADMRLTDVNGPRGGIDKRCHVELKTNLVGTVIVTSTAGDWRTAIESALTRATKVLLRNVRRNKSPRHVRLHAAEL